MMRKIYLFLLFLVFWGTNGLMAQSNCVSGCNDNTFVWSTTPNTIEYDNMISTFHSTILKETDGTVKIWGESSAANGTSDLSTPTIVRPASGFNYTGSILKIAAGSASNSNRQFVILTTSGLYAWGTAGGVVPSGLKSGTAFGKVSAGTGANTYGLPNGVNPSDVKMLFGTHQTLVITTCTGDVWVMSAIGAKNGDGTTGTAPDNVWHSVFTSTTTNGSTKGEKLTGVVATRGTAKALMALTENGEIYTWGSNTYIGGTSGGAPANRIYATKMNLPSGLTPKMIGMTANNGESVDQSYYVLGTNGQLWAMGNNENRQLGDFSTTERRDWVRVKSTNASTDMPEIVWVSPNEHDYSGNAAINALTKDGKLWSWGSNSGQMIGGGTNTGAKDPIFMNRGLDGNDRLIAVETGGHTTMVIRQCSKKYGYIGHKVSGSMGDGTTAGSNVSTFDFANTAEINLCGAPTAPPVQDIEICAGETGNLGSAHTASLPTGTGIEWWTTANRANGTRVADPTKVGIGTYYAFYIPTEGTCTSPPASIPVEVKYRLKGCPVDVDIAKSVNKTAPKVGEQVVFTLKVTNKGPGTAEAVMANDKLPSGYTYVTHQTTTGTYVPATGVWTIGDLTNGQIVSLDITATVKPSTGTADEYKNTATVQANTTDPNPGDNESTSTPHIPNLEFVKTAVISTDAGTLGKADLNDIITYTFTLKNTGNITLTNVAASDPKIPTGISMSPTILAPGEVATGSAVYTVTQADVDAGVVLNMATGGAQQLGGKDMLPTQSGIPGKPGMPGKPGTPNEVPVAQNPAMTVTKTVTSTAPYTTVGQVISYDIVVKNTGNVTLKDIVLADANAVIPEGQENIGILAPNQSKTVKVTHSITQGDLNAGTVSNQATVNGKDPKDKPLTPVPSDDPNTPAPEDPTDVDMTPVGSIAVQKVARSGTFNKVGDVITYDFIVKNTGNVTITNLTLTDSKIKGQITLSTTTLTPGQEATAQASYTVTQADLDAGTVLNQATAKGQDPAAREVTDKSGTDLTNDTVTETGLVFTPSIAIVKQASAGTYTKVGDKITYVFSITNTGNVTLNNLTITDTKIKNPIVPQLLVLAPGVSTTATAIYEVTQEDLDAGVVTNTATATGNDPKGVPTTDKSGSTTTNDDPTTTPLQQNPKIALTKKSAAGNYSKVGDIITYTFTVTNVGNVTLSNIKVSDPKVGANITLNKTVLKPGEQASGTATYTVTQADIDAGVVSNTATVTGTDPKNNTTTDKSGSDNGNDNPTLTPIAQNGSMTLTKASSGTFAKAGDVVTYTFTLKNTGNTTLTGVTVTDPLIKSPIVLNKTVLAPGESTIGTATYVVIQADVDNGEVVNVATGNSTNPPVGPVSSDDPKKPGTDDPTVTPADQQGKLSLVKTAAAGTYTKVGDEITYTFTIKNEGNVTLRNIIISDAKLGADINLATVTLAPGESTVATAKYKITQGDLNAGQVVNTATATGKDPNGNDVSDKSGSNTNNDTPTTTLLEQQGKITVVKEAAAGNFTQVGNTITYTFTIQNTGNVELHDVKVTDSKITGPITVAKTTLVPGESTTATATYTITQVDLDAGIVRNSAIVTGLDPNNKTVKDISGTATNNDTPTETALSPTGKLYLVKKAAGTFSKAGDEITYQFTVKNTGNVTLNNLTISDNKIVGLIQVTPTKLAPGETATGTAIYRITQADVDAGQIQNSAKATAVDPLNNEVIDVSGTDGTNDSPTVTPITQSGQIRLVKTAASGTFSKVGDKILYHFVISNVGNVTLTNVVVTDPKISGSITVEATTLAPGQTTTGTAEYFITQADLDAGTLTNSATATAKDPKDVTVTDKSGSSTDNDTPTVTTLNPKGSIAIVKKAAVGKYNTVGQVIPYIFTVKNTGNITLMNVTVTDDKLSGPITLGKTTLAPGEETTGSGSYTITQADLNRGTFTNQALATGTTPTGTEVTDNSGSLFDNNEPTITPLDQEGDMTLTKSTSGVFNNVGDVITYTFTLKNTGNITLEGLVVTDPKITVPIILDKDVLDPDEVATGTATYVVTQADVDAGFVLNKATGTSDTPPVGPIESDDPTTPTPNDPTTTPGNRKGAIAFVKTAATGTYNKVGDEINYSFTVTNTGNITLHNVRINDSKIIGTITLDKVDLAPNETASGTAKYKVTQADLDRGYVENTAIAYGKGADDIEVTDVSGSNNTNDAPTRTVVSREPAITLVKQASSGVFRKVGDKITYSFTVTNTGNVTLNAITVSDPLISGGNISLAKTTLAPGESTSGQAVYAITQVDLNAKQVINQATAKGTVPDNTTVQDKSGTTGTNDEATVTPLVWTPIVAVPDSEGPINGTDGGTTSSVLINDELDGRVLNPKDVVLTPGTSPNAGIVMDPSTGVVTVAPGTAAGEYKYPYTICEVLNTSNCSTTIVTIVVEAAPIEAVVDTPPAINGKDGGNTPSVWDNDKLNNKPVDPKDIITTVEKPADPKTPGAPVPTLDPKTGIVTVDPETPAGEYEITYKICEVLNPNNCDETTVTIVVEAPLIEAMVDTPPAINGKDGGKTPSVWENDKLNNKPVDPKDIITTVEKPADPKSPGAPVPTLDPKTGVVTVVPGTPAGEYEITYKICEVLNPTNCDETTVTIVVEAPLIEAVVDTPPAINGKDGGKTPSVWDNDKLNNKPVDPKDIITTVEKPADPKTPGAPVPTLDPKTGVVTVDPETPAGEYEITYKICEVLNPNNCSTTTVTITVTAPDIKAEDDALGPINGKDGNTNAGNVLANNGNGTDGYNGKPATLTDVEIKNIVPATPNTGAVNSNVPVLDPATGNVSVPAKTPAGTYEITYTIEDKLNPGNTSTATVTVVVDPAPIEAVVDTPPAINGKDGGNTASVWENDKLNNKPVAPKDIITTVEKPTDPKTPGAPVPTLDPKTGIVTVDPETPAGEYEITYKICEVLNPTNCSTTTVTITVTAPDIKAEDDALGPINGKDGNTNAGNVLANNGNGTDGYNGKPATVADVAIKNIVPATPNTGAVNSNVPVLDPATGNVSVPANTPAGTYEITYTIEDKLNPGNTSTATVTVIVDPAVIEAVVDTPPAINGKDGGKTPSVWENDKLNNKPVDPKDIITTVEKPADSKTPGAPVPTLDPKTGIVTVDPETPAGEYEITYKICEVLNPNNCSSVVVKVVVAPAPIVAVDDPIKLEWSKQEVTTESVLKNDSYNGKPIDLTEVTLKPGVPSNPGLTMNPDGTITIAPSTRPGTYTYPYTICEVLNPTNCSTAVATIVIEASDLFIPNTFTPNGDGTNDTFEIVGIENFDQVGLVIVNRWGNEVYRNDRYDNRWNGAGLNEGTYYYIITTMKGSQKNVLKGWVLIKTR